MSLNGLDGEGVIEAYQATLAEPGAWFLLKYVTRDTIDLLQRGTGGVIEVRVAIEQYQEQSPVYGLVQYRRRKVVLKYVPVGTSRLLQARLTVQFQSVLERFTPYDAVFSFTAATQLTESALSSACMLHASIGSLNSSSSSLHRHRLGEIAEDAEEGAGERRKSGLRYNILSDANGSSTNEKPNLALPAPTASILSMPSYLPKGSSSSSTPDSQISELPPIPTFDKSLPATPEETPRSTLDGKVADGEAKAVIEELARSTPDDPRPSFESRPSSAHSTRPSVKNLDRTYLSAKYTPYKPKIRLGPRPSAQRPPTPASQGEARPIANLPNSVRVSNRPSSSAGRPPSSASHRPISQQSNRSTHSTFVPHSNVNPPPPLLHSSVHISALYQPPTYYLLDRPASPAPSKAPSVKQPSAQNGGPPTITPEKQRLMRALQLRKKQQTAKHRNQPRSSSLPTPPDRHMTENEESPDQTQERSNVHRRSCSRDNSAKSHNEVLTGNTLSYDLHARATPDSAGRGDPMAESIRSLRVDSSLDSKDAELRSDTTASGSATSEMTAASLKSAPVVQTRSPVLLPITQQNRLSPGASFLELEPDPQRPRQTNQIAEATASKRMGDGDGAAPQASPQFNPSLPFTVPEMPSSQPRSTTPITANEESTGTAFPVRPRSLGLKSAPTAADERSSRLTTQSEPVVADANPAQDRQGLERYNSTSNPNVSDTSDDESFYDELQTATVQEAKPVMVGRSPITAIFNGGNRNRQWERNRTTSSARLKNSESRRVTPENMMTGGRSPSSALPQWPPTGEAAQTLLVKSTNVSSEISKRIKALEVFTGRIETGTSPPNTATPPSPPVNAGLVKKRLSAHSSDEKTTHTISRTSPPAKQPHCPSSAPTPTPAPVSGDVQPSWNQWNRSGTDMAAPKRKGDSISVTARIIRDPHDNRPTESSTPSKPATMDLRRSPLVVEHENVAPTSRAETASTGRSVISPYHPNLADMEVTEASKSEQRRFSSSSIHSAAGKLPQSESFTKRLSMTTRHTRNESSNLPRSASDSSSIADDKVLKESRKARLMKRVSLFTAGSRRSIASAFSSHHTRQGDPASMTAQPHGLIAENEGELSPEQSSIAESHAHVVDIGDVNIQFPDTLLWKRRFMRIDDQGFLILTPPTTEVNKRGISRRFHLSDFKQPFLPSHEREELPWSIVLEFEDGGGLQCACESRYAQIQVLRMLTDAHVAYNSLYVHC